MTSDSFPRGAEPAEPAENEDQHLCGLTDKVAVDRFGRAIKWTRSFSP